MRRKLIFAKHISLAIQLHQQFIALAFVVAMKINSCHAALGSVDEISARYILLRSCSSLAHMVVCSARLVVVVESFDD